MVLDFTRDLVTVEDNIPVNYNGVSPDGLWHVVTYFSSDSQGGSSNNIMYYSDTEQYISFYSESGGGGSSDTVSGWNTVEVNGEGILRSDIEDEVENPTPFLKYRITLQEVVLAIYPDGSTVSTHYNPESLPMGEVGRIKIVYEYDGAVIIGIRSQELLPVRG